MRAIIRFFTVPLIYRLHITSAWMILSYLILLSWSLVQFFDIFKRFLLVLRTSQADILLPLLFLFSLFGRSLFFFKVFVHRWHFNRCLLLRTFGIIVWMNHRINRLDQIGLCTSWRQFLDLEHIYIYRLLSNFLRNYLNFLIFELFLKIWVLRKSFFHVSFFAS